MLFKSMFFIGWSLSRLLELSSSASIAGKVQPQYASWRCFTFSISHGDTNFVNLRSIIASFPIAASLPSQPAMRQQDRIVVCHALVCLRLGLQLQAFPLRIFSSIVLHIVVQKVAQRLRRFDILSDISCNAHLSSSLTPPTKQLQATAPAGAQSALSAP